MTRSTVLLICADPPLIQTIRELVLPIDGLQLRIVGEANELFFSSRQIADAVVLIHLAEGSDGVEAARLLRMLASAQNSVPVIVLSDEHRPAQSLELLRLGAADCLSRPLDLHRLSYLIDVLTVRARYAIRKTMAAAKPIENFGCETRFFFVSQSATAKLMEKVQRVASQNTTVLLGGETGTGKTCLARVIHERSPRRSKPFLVINCGMLSANLIESELFGHVKGAFTGADRDRTGKFAEVGEGTLLIDEIDALPLSLQAKLLRALEERVFEPVGSNRTCTLQARLIVASNRDLEHEVADGRFRADLYYRLNVVSFALPPLRERRDLIVALAERFRADFAASNDLPVQGISDEVQTALKQYNWPGNIRELRNVVERAVALCAGPFIEIGDLPETMWGGAIQSGAPSAIDVLSVGTLAQSKDEAEYQRILVALQQHNNNRLRVAAELGISRMTLYRKPHRFGLFGAT